MEPEVKSTSFLWAKPFACHISINSHISLRSVLMWLLFYSQETGLGKKLAKVKMFNRTARMMMLVRLVLAAMSWSIGNVMWHLTVPVSSHPCPYLPSEARDQFVNGRSGARVHVFADKLVSYSFVTYPLSQSNTQSGFDHVEWILYFRPCANKFL